jgi:hypothetical protein
MEIKHISACSNSPLLQARDYFPSIFLWLTVVLSRESGTFKKLIQFI